jgi:hypothetical protein
MTTAAPVIVRNRFVNASTEHTEPAYDSGQVAAGTTLSNIEVPAYGYLNSLFCVLTVTSTGNAATVTAGDAGVFGAIASIGLTDVNGANLFGPMPGYEAMLTNKYGGYQFASDLRTSNFFAATTVGSGATAGSGAFAFRIPVEINHRDGYGSLPNMNAASTFKLNCAIASLASQFGVAPNGAVTFRLQVWLEAWMLPAASAVDGSPNEQAPPGVGSYQRWVMNTLTVNNGANTLRMPNVGNLIRNLILVFRNATPVRVDSTFMDPIAVNVDGLSVLNHARNLQKHYMIERYGYIGTADAANGLDTGVFVYPFTCELDGHPGFETREMYLRTNQATRLEVVGTTTAAGTLTVLTNDVIPVGGSLTAA